MARILIAVAIAAQLLVVAPAGAKEAEMAQVVNSADAGAGSLQSPTDRIDAERQAAPKQTENKPAKRKEHPLLGGIAGGILAAVFSTVGI
jgi:hypothetical protein